MNARDALGAALGFVIAALIGLTGVGGGTLTVPALVLGLGVPAAEAVGTALAFSTLVKLPAAAVYLRTRRVDHAALARLLAGGLPGVVVGALAMGWLDQARWRPLVLAAVGATVALTALVSLALGARSRPAAEERTPRRGRGRLLGLLAVPIGLEVGFSSAGAGALGTLLLMGTTTLPMVQVVGTDLLFGLALSACGGLLHVGLGDWQPGLLLALAVGGLPGALVGARLAAHVPGQALRRLLLAWLVVLGLLLLRRGLHG